MIWKQKYRSINNVYVCKFLHSGFHCVYFYGTILMLVKLILYHFPAKLYYIFFILCNNLILVPSVLKILVFHAAAPRCPDTTNEFKNEIRCSSMFDSVRVRVYTLLQ
jgi:hypothetical protein